MGGKTKLGVPYLHKVDNEEIAAITRGVCFFFGENCNVVFKDGKLVGYVDYVGKNGPDMRFIVRGKSDSVKGEFDDKFVELLAWKGFPVPMME